MPTAIDYGEQVALMLEAVSLGEQSLRCSFIWGGDEYPCQGGPEFGGPKLEEGGYRSGAKLKIKVRVEVFPDGVGIPKERQTILYKRNGSAEPQKYKIVGVTNYYGAILELNCEDPNQGA